MGNSRNSFTKTSTLNSQPRIPDVWRGQSPHRLNCAETAATVASSTYSRSSTMPPSNVDSYAHYPLPRPQHSTHSSYDSVTALTSRLLRTHTQTPPPTHHSPRGRSPISPRDQQASLNYNALVYPRASEGSCRRKIWPPQSGMSHTQPPRTSCVPHAKSGTID